MKRPLTEHPIAPVLSLLAAIALWLVIRERATPHRDPPAPVQKSD
jgi:hypothetical protein